MKKTVTFIAMMFLFAAISAQTVSVTFTGRDANNQYVPLNRVVVSNLTKGWQETLTWPDDTILTMTDQTGIGNIEMQDFASLYLSQNTPNPFDGITFANLLVAEQGDVSLEIIDISGRVVRANKYSSLQPGTHVIRITLSSTGIYFLTARQNGRTSSVKMVNRSIGSGNSMALVGIVQPKNGVKDVTDNPFEAGDTMEYVGYATINHNEVESEHIVQQQMLSETILLSFAEAQYGLPCPNVPTVTDYDGNIYNTVLIGQQCWMKENMRTTHYHNGTAIAVGNGNPATNEVSYFIPGNNDVTMYGYLYSKAAMNHSTNIGDSTSMVIQGVCPPGWHIPSNEEFIQLCGFVGSVPDFVCGSDTAKIAKALASKQGWSSDNKYCVPGNNQSLNNATGFTAYPAGFSGYFIGRQAYLWTSAGYEFVIDYEEPNTHLSSDYSNEGLSVRCIFGIGVSDISVNTAAVSGISGLSALCGGTVSTGGETVIARGLCWSTSPEPTLSNDHTISGSAEGSFTDSLTGLLPNTTYYVRAYVTINAGTAYGNQRSFITLTDPLNG
nr:T9SS type A sorting domain-containing protein [Bacteroidales bacterium]